MKKNLALLLVLTLALAACRNGEAGTGGQSASTGSTPASSNTADGSASSDSNGEENPAPNPVDIGGDLLVWFDHMDLGGEIIAAFNAHYPNVNISLEEVGSGSVNDKLPLDGPAGIGGDVMVFNHNAIADFINDGLLEPFPADMQARLEVLLLENAASMAKNRGALYGVPYSLENYGLLYNKDLVDTPPKTFEELIEFAHSYNDPANNKFAIRFTPNDFYHTFYIFDAFGFKPFGPNGDDWKNPGFDGPEVAAGLAFLKSLRPLFDINVADADFESVYGAFARGEVPFIVAHSWVSNNAKENGVNVGASKLPTIGGVQPNCFMGSMVMGVSSYAKNFEAAFAFAEFMSSKEVATLVYNKNGVGPALKDISGIEGLEDDEVLMGLAEQAVYTVDMPTVPEFNLIWSIVMEMMAYVWDDLLPIEEAQQSFMESYELLLNIGGQSMFD